MKQQQFLNLASSEEAELRFWNAVQPQPLGKELVLLKFALGRILADDVFARHNVPYFDRSNFDGFAVRAEDTFDAQETSPIYLSLNHEILSCGVVPKETLLPGTATTIATGGVIPRGADGVVMIENTFPIEDHQSKENGIQVIKPIVPGGGISLAGSDIGAGELVLREGIQMGFRETGTLAALGESNISVWKRPKVAVISSGDELIRPDESMSLGKVYDTNGTIISHALKELCCEAIDFGIIQDDESKLEKTLREALELDFVIISGGTSKGEGDLNYRIFEKFNVQLGMVHGVALKPGKPLCMAVIDGTPATILPGFPTSAIFTFNKFIAPVLRALAGMSQENYSKVEAHLPARLNSEKGKTEFNLVHLLKNSSGFSAFSTGKGSGSITGFARADGFIEIPRNTEMIEAGDKVSVQLLGKYNRPPDLTIIGSHCIGLDYLIGEIQKRGISCQFLPVGSMGGVLAAKRGECDLASSHLLDPKSGIYNIHLLTKKLHLEKGYRRNQGLLFRKDDPNFVECKNDFYNIIQRSINNPEIRMINRNRGSGTRILLDRLLKNNKPTGFYQEAKSHNSVAAAISQKRADWGIAILSVAENSSLGFYPIQHEEFDFIIPKERMKRFEVIEFLKLLKEKKIHNHLISIGLEIGKQN